LPTFNGPSHARAGRCAAASACPAASAPLRRAPPGVRGAIGISVLEGWGSPSASVAFANPLTPRCKVGSPGRPWDGGASSRRTGRGGRRAARRIARRNACRYHKDPEATARTLRPGGWLATGDLGHRDADGFYFITGRTKELIIKGGENIAPREIDEGCWRTAARGAGGRHPDREYGQETCVRRVEAGRACRCRAARPLSSVGR
jgi:long-chain acyl-CoA synthetase